MGGLLEDLHLIAITTLIRASRSALGKHFHAADKHQGQAIVNREMDHQGGNDRAAHSKTKGGKRIEWFTKLVRIVAHAFESRSNCCQEFFASALARSTAL
jgi:hypothetical protein